MLINARFMTPLGGFEVCHDEHFIYQSSFKDLDDFACNHPLSKQIEKELSAYFKNPHHRFQLQLKPHGSSFQQKVWNALRVIPAGRTLSYGELAHHLQTSPRAIGQACKTNKITLFIPCHRIVGKHNPGGFMGKEEALQYKLNLLEHEQGYPFRK